MPRLANFDVGLAQARALRWAEAHLLDWDVLGRVRDRWQGPLALKGLMTLADARRAAGLGVDAIILSNHGGRQMDCLPAPIELLPDFVREVGHELEILVDSGFRRGSDVLKALALGARACLIGRPYLYGLAAGGEAGVERALAIVRDELERDMRLLGIPGVSAIGADLVRPVGRLMSTGG